MKYIIAFCVICFPLFQTNVSGTDTCSKTSPCKLKGGLPLVQPRQIHSSNGFLQLNLSVQVGEFTVDWLTLSRRSYNGEFPGPTWCIKAGDVVNLTLTNKLQKPDFVSKHNNLQFPNHTNIHTHGLHISGLRPHDNVFVNVTPENGQYHYNYPIVSDHPAGTYWYHPHLHGSVDFQTNSGMSGMIIVEDPTDSTTPQHLLDASCPGKCEHDVQLIFQSLLFYTGRGFASAQQSMHDRLFTLNGRTACLAENRACWVHVDGNLVYRLNRTRIKGAGNKTLLDWINNTKNGVENFTTNGQLNPVLNIITGQVKRFRMVNAGARQVLELFVADEHNNSACDFYEIAVDGVYLDNPTRPRFGKSFVVPASRIDWLIVCNKPGTYYLKSYAPDFEMISTAKISRYNGTLLTIVATGPETKTTIPSELPKRPEYVSDFRNLTQDQVHGRFVLEAGGGITLNREYFKNEEFWRYNVEVDTVQEWYLTNTGTVESHPIHIHVNSFQVISYNAYTGPFDSNSMKYWNQKMEPCFYQFGGYNESADVQIPKDPLRYLGHEKRWKDGNGGPETIGLSQPGVFRDVILVPPLSNITIRFMTNKFIGDVVIHCHILIHEDFGMMTTVRILPKGSDLNANVSVRSGDAYPGTCDECDPFPFNNRSQCVQSGSASHLILDRWLIVLLTLSTYWLQWILNN